MYLYVNKIFTYKARYIYVIYTHACFIYIYVHNEGTFCYVPMYVCACLCVCRCTCVLRCTHMCMHMHVMSENDLQYFWIGSSAMVCPNKSFMFISLFSNNDGKLINTKFNKKVSLNVGVW